MNQPHPTSIRPGLGPKQLQWCDQYLGKFKVFREQAEAATKHSDETRKAVRQ
jgi:hypothetical protein